MNVKFGVFADLHIDIMHDGEARMAEFLDACRKEDVDFVVHLGDYVYPNEDRKCICKPENIPANVQSALNGIAQVDKEKILKMYAEFEKPSYHTIGNHECDVCSKEQILSYWKQDKAYYSFDKGGVHFVVLDGNYGKVDGEFVSYENGNYFDFPKCIPYLSDTQLSWLEKDLKEAKYPAVLFSHQRLTEGYASIQNAGDLRAILKKAPNGVPLAINGHEHRDTLDYVDGTYFLNLNSISCMWVGTKYADLGKYSAEIDEKFPDIRHVIPYDKPLYTIVTITDAGAEIKGCKAEFVGKTPDALGINDPDSGFVKKGIVITSNIQQRFLSFEK